MSVPVAGALGHVRGEIGERLFVQDIRFGVAVLRNEREATYMIYTQKNSFQFQSFMIQQLQLQHIFRACLQISGRKPGGT